MICFFPSRVCYFLLFVLSLVVLCNCGLPVSIETLVNLPAEASSASMLIAESSTSFLGISSLGGLYGYGNIFRITSSGQYSDLYAFDGSTTGSYPSGITPMNDGTGRYIGATSLGALYNFGTLFTFNPQTLQFNIIIVFASSAGAVLGSPVADSAGNFRFVSPIAGSGGGAIYIYNSITQQVSLNVSFGLATLPNTPRSSLIAEENTSNFLGTSYYGGTNAYGTIYRLTASGQITLLYAFEGGVNGSHPSSALVGDNQGNYYGCLATGGTNNLGMLYSFTPSTASFQFLHSFTSTEGQGCSSQLLPDFTGNFYGLLPAQSPIPGALFKYNSNSQTVTILYKFAAATGWGVGSPVFESGTQNLLISTSGYGAGLVDVRGTISRYALNTNQFSVVYVFKRPLGASCWSKMISDGEGSFLATCSSGDLYDSYGSIIKFSPPYTVSHLYSFGSQVNDSTAPIGSLITSAEGLNNIYYGTSSTGGYFNHGTVYSFNSINNQVIVIHSFNGTDGSTPSAALVSDGNGNYLSTTTYGGKYNKGTIFLFTPSLNLVSSIHSFSGPEGSTPYYSTLTSDGLGGWLGQTSIGGIGYGNIYHLTGNLMNISSISVINLFSFNTVGSFPGTIPYGTLVSNGNGLFYGLASAGGSYLDGSFYSFQLVGKVYTDIFSMYINNASPVGDVLFDKASQSVVGTSHVFAFVYNQTLNTYNGYFYNGYGISGEGNTGGFVGDGNGTFYAINNALSTGGGAFIYTLTFNSLPPPHTVSSSSSSTAAVYSSSMISSSDIQISSGGSSISTSPSSTAPTGTSTSTTTNNNNQLTSVSSSASSIITSVTSIISSSSSTGSNDNNNNLNINSAVNIHSEICSSILICTIIIIMMMKFI